MEHFQLNTTCTSGCTDPLANNYDPTANFDDGSCNYAPCAAQLLIIKISALVHYQLELAYLTNGRFLLQREVLGYLQEILVCCFK